MKTKTSSFYRHSLSFFLGTTVALLPGGRIILEGHGAGEGREAGPVPGAEVDAGAAQQHVDDALLPGLDGVVQRALALSVLVDSSLGDLGHQPYDRFAENNKNLQK